MAKMVLNVAICPPGYTYKKWCVHPVTGRKYIDELAIICHQGDVIEVRDEYMDSLREHGITLPTGCNTAEEYIRLMQVNGVASRTADTTPVTKYPEFGELRAEACVGGQSASRATE